MDLFTTGEPYNVLPYDGTAIYYGPIMPLAEADLYRDYLLQNAHWYHDETVLFGKHIVTARKIAWYADEPYEYKYSGTVRVATLWTPEMLELKLLIEEKTGATFNSCLLNLYHSGAEGMSWHSDDERSMGYNPIIASLSLGAERKFAFKHKTTKQTESVILEHGALLVMKDETQGHWLHSVPKTKKITQPRINLTFRTMVGRGL